MPTPALGLEERVGIGIEAHSAYGTLVSPNALILSETFGMEKVAPKEPVPGRFGPTRGYRGASSAVPRRVNLPTKTQGPWTVPLEFVSTMQLAYNVLCKDNAGTPVGYAFQSSIDVDGNVSSEPNRHRFTMQEHTNDVPRALSLIRFNGQEQHGFLGSYIRSLEIVVAENGMGVINMDLLGRSLDRTAAESQPAVPSSPFVRITECALTYSSTVGSLRGTHTTFGNVQSFRLRVGHTLREIAGTTGTLPPPLDPNAIQQPIPIDYSVVEGSFMTDWNQDTWMDFWDATTIADNYACLEFRITSEQDTTAGAGKPFEMVLRVPAALITGRYPADPGGPGVIPEEVTFEGDSGSTGEGPLVWEFYNDEIDMTTGGEPLA